MDTANVSLKNAERQKKRSAVTSFFVRLVKEKPLGLAGGIVVLILLIVGIFADQLAPYGMNQAFPYDSLSPPSSDYLLGTDHLGRDLLSRMIFGARTSLIVGLSASSISVVIATVLGTLSGYIGGKLDTILQRFVDAWMCFPGLVLLILISSIFGASMWMVIILLGFVYGIGSSRIVRGATISIKQSVYIDAAVAVGGSNLIVLTRHILPNILAPIIILFTTQMPAIIMTEASLSFLGFGIPPPTPSWGAMLSGSGRSFMFMAPWMAIWPGVALGVIVFGINMFGDAVRDILDPRLKGGLGRYGNPKLKKRNK